MEEEEEEGGREIITLVCIKTAFLNESNYAHRSAVTARKATEKHPQKNPQNFAFDHSGTTLELIFAIQTI